MFADSLFSCLCLMSVVFELRLKVLVVICVFVFLLCASLCGWFLFALRTYFAGLLM